MFKNYLTTALRNIWKFRLYSFINLMGLAVGMAACLLIYMFVSHELSFDRFHRQAAHIYRLNEVQSFGGLTPQHVALSMFPMGEALQNDYPEIRAYTRFWKSSDWLFRAGNKELFIRDCRIVDPAIFRMFDFRLLQGDTATALNEPNSLVLSETLARSFFGDENPLGRTIIQDDTVAFHITGVMEDAPGNSHLQFDALVSISTRDSERRRSSWGSNYLCTYLLLEANADIRALEALFPGFVTKYMGDGATDAYQLYLQPLTDIHLGSAHITHDYQNYRKFNRDYVVIFVVLAAFILLIAAINFMNISTARSAYRAREVGIRKTVGARRRQLAGQFIGESVLMAFLAFILAVAIAQLLLPQVNTLSGRELTFNLHENPLIFPAALAIVLLTGLMSGFYPALLLSAFQPVKMLKGVSGGLASRSRLRNILVITQFAIAVALIVGTVITVQQMTFMRSHNLGFNMDQVLVIPMSEAANDKYETLRDQLLSHADIIGVTASGQRLGNNIHQMGSRYEGLDEGLGISVLNVDLNYLQFYQMEILQGRSFDPDNQADRGNRYLLNEALVEKLGWDAPLGKGAKLSWRDEMGTVIGVVKNFHYNSLHHRVEPLLITSQEWGFSELSVRINSANIEGALAYLRATWGLLVADRPLEYTFLDDHFAALYTADRQTSKVLTAIAGLAIFIACLGLFGLSSITTQQRTREIGIRKVLGASVGSLVVMLSRGFALMVFAAFLIAIPLTYYLMQWWLQNFALRIDIGAEAFIIAGLAALFIAIFTISFHAVRTARANPVKALRYE